MNTIKVKLTGMTALLMHNCQGADPSFPLTIEKKKLTGLRKKTDEIHEQISKLEWLSALYWNNKFGACVPDRLLKGAIVASSKKDKKGKIYGASCIVLTDEAELIFHDSKMSESELYETGKYIDRRIVNVQRSRVVRVRPIFDEWSCVFELAFDPAAIEEKDLLNTLARAGQIIGIGDYRPDCGGPYGRFTVEKIK